MRQGRNIPFARAQNNGQPWGVQRGRASIEAALSGANVRRTYNRALIPSLLKHLASSSGHFSLRINTASHEAAWE